MIELISNETVLSTWPDETPGVALEAFWNRLLFGGSWDDQRREWFRLRLRLPGRPELAFTSAATPQLTALQVRCSEEGFFAALVRRHVELIDRPFEFAPLLALPVALPVELRRVVEALRDALSVTAPLVHLGLIGEALPRAPEATFTLTTRYGSHANGAGTVTNSSEWNLDLHEPLRLRVCVQLLLEYTSEQWSFELHHTPTPTSLAPLIDAFKERDLYLTVKQVKLEP